MKRIKFHCGNAVPSSKFKGMESAAAKETTPHSRPTNNHGSFPAWCL